MHERARAFQVDYFRKMKRTTCEHQSRKGVRHLMRREMAGCRKWMRLDRLDVEIRRKGGNVIRDHRD